MRLYLSPRSAPASSLVYLAICLTGCMKQDASNDRAMHDQALKQKEDTLKALSKSIKKENTPPFGEHYIVDMHGQPFTDAHVAALADLRVISHLDLSDTSVTDEQLARLRDARSTNSFYKVNLSKTAVTDASLGWLADSPILVELNVSGTKVTPAGVEALKQKRKSNSGIDPRVKTMNVITK